MDKSEVDTIVKRFEDPRANKERRSATEELGFQDDNLS
jgi:hypothetical protein